MPLTYVPFWQLSQVLHDYQMRDWSQEHPKLKRNRKNLQVLGIWSLEYEIGQKHTERQIGRSSNFVPLIMMARIPREMLPGLYIHLLHQIHNVKCKTRFWIKKSFRHVVCRTNVRSAFLTCNQWEWARSRFPDGIKSLMCRLFFQTSICWRHSAPMLYVVSSACSGEKTHRSILMHGKSGLSLSKHLSPRGIFPRSLLWTPHSGVKKW